MSWPALLVLAAGAYGFKVAGVVAGNRLGESPLRRAIQLIPPAMFAALVVLQTFEREASLVLDARAVGLLVAIVASVRRVPFIGVIVMAMVATAVTRLIVG